MLCGNFLMTVCGYCKEAYILTEVGKPHGCQEGKAPKIIEINEPQQTMEIVGEHFSGGRRVSRY
jgi:hypothetical protein